MTYVIHIQGSCRPSLYTVYDQHNQTKLINLLTSDLDVGAVKVQWLKTFF